MSTIGNASTTPDVDDLRQIALPLETIMQVDALGFDCIREEDIDAAFHMTGKGMRLPQTCQPDPCKAALTKDELGALIGRAPTPSEWEDYYARYADRCIAEVLPFEEEPVFTDGELPPFDAFWEPLVSSYGPFAPILTQFSNGGVTRALPPLRASQPGSFSSGTSLRGGGFSGSSGGRTIVNTNNEEKPVITVTKKPPPTGGDRITITSSNPPPAAIPVPPAFGLLALSLLGFLHVARRRSRA